MMNKKKSKINPFNRAKIFSATSIIALSTAFANAQTEDVYKFELNELPLSEALMRFSEQTKAVITVRSDLLAGKKSPKIHGEMTAKEALSYLLKGTNFNVREQKDGTLIIGGPKTQNVSNFKTISYSLDSEDISHYESNLYDEDIDAEGDEVDELSLDEVVVTATARRQTVQEIPYNISALSGSELEARQITDQNELLREISGVTVVDRGHRNSGTVNSIVMRGINVENGLVGDNSPNAIAAVATYVDGTPIFGNFVLKDIERVEVLRGPQGTLYGSGALSGTVRYIMNKPDTEEFDALITADLGTTEGSGGINMNFDATINIPISERVAFRANIGHINNDGIIDYINAYQLSENREPLVNVDGNCVDPRLATDAQVLNNVACFENQEDADWVNIDYVRAALSLELTDSFSLLFSYQGQRDEIGARRSVTLGDNGQPTDSELYFEYDQYDSGQVLLEPSERDVNLFALDVEWDLGFALLTSNTSYYDHDGVGERDNGGLWVSGGRDFINWLYTGWARPAQRTQAGFKDETFVQEIRLISQSEDAAIDWLVGAFYMDQKINSFSNSFNPGMNRFNQACRNTGDPICANFWPRFFPELTENDFEYKRNVMFEEIALYGEVTWHISDSFRINAGLRWFHNETTTDGVMGFPLVVGWVSPAVAPTFDESDDLFTKINLSFDINENHMIYATRSEGYRRGGANAVPSLENGDTFGEPNSDIISTFGSDTVVNYEVGIKGATEVFSYSVAGYYIDWTTPQVNTATALYGFLIAANASSAFSQGFEAEIEGYITDTLHYRVGYSWSQSELDEDFISPQTGNLIAPSGSILPTSPSHSINFTVDNTWAVGENSSLVARISGYFQSSSQNFIDENSPINQTLESFWLFGGSVTYYQEDLSVSLYVKNLFNDAGVTAAYPEEYWGADTGVFEGWYGNGNRQIITQPRTVGIKVAYGF